MVKYFLVYFYASTHLMDGTSSIMFLFVCVCVSSVTNFYFVSYFCHMFVLLTHLVEFKLFVIPAKAFARDCVITGVHLSVSLFVCLMPR